jgi:Cyclin, C-terminal domain
VTPGVLSLAMYLCELAVLEYDMAAYPHSTRAASALLLAQLSVGTPQYTTTVASLILGTGLDPASLAVCMEALLRLQQAAYCFALSAASNGSVAPSAAGGVSDLLAPLRAKFGARCWCEAAIMPPVASVPTEQHWACF